MTFYNNNELKYKELIKVSDPEKVLENLKKYLGDDVKLYISNTKTHKYYVINPNNNRKINFGNINYSDYSRHNDDDRREAYLRRSGNLKGNWRDNPYSPNNLSRAGLWSSMVK
jgi:hypothetical protein